MPPILSIQNLSVTFQTALGSLAAVNDLSLQINRGETLALVGESGCGKSMTAYSILRLIPPSGAISSGEIIFEDTNLLDLDESELRAIRGNRISMIFQEPMTSLNPVFRIGEQIAEGLMLHRQVSRKDADMEVIRLLAQVGIPSPAERARDYPHQLSGGMRQRVMIAMALACRPMLLIADEPTTALDVTIQAQILELLEQLKQEQEMAMLLITHDLGIVAERSSRTCVMYAGRIVEQATTGELLANPLHPYSKGLLGSLPQLGAPGKPLQVIQGTVPARYTRASGCGFCERCPLASDICRKETPELREVNKEHFVRCWKSP